MSSHYQNVSLNIADRVARITLARPPVNILNIAMMREINDALDRVSKCHEIVAIVFDAGPECRAFSAGVAVDEHGADVVFQMLDEFHGIFRLLEQLGRPVIAVVDGPALGGGCELVMACDMAIASERARFGQPEIKLGVFPPIAALLLPQIVGDRRARELILTGELIDAQEAYRFGLVNYVVPPEQLESKTLEVLSKFRGLSAAALQVARKALDRGRRQSLDETLRPIEDMYLHELMKTQDATEGLNAFIEKRKAVWRDR